MIGLSDFLKLQSFANAKSQLQQVEAKLKAHLEEDRDAIETEFRAAIAHFEEEVEHLAAKLHPDVKAGIDAGLPPQVAFEQAQIKEATPPAA